MRPALTVITPSFNQGTFIERTIQSVLDQGYENLEYVVVDGGSTDGSLEIIKRYEDRLSWWVSEPDEGQTHAINKGIERTSGEVVAYINSDDYYLPGAFETAIAALERSERSWIAGAAPNVDEEDDVLLMWKPARPEASEGRWLPGRHWWMVVPWCVPQPSAFWRRDLFDQYGLFRRDMHFAFDAEFMLRLAYAGEIPEVLPESVLSARVVHEAQKSANPRPFFKEIRSFKPLFRDQLTPRERRRLRAVSAAMRLRDDLLYPLLQLGGRALEHVPECVRPPIRDRDRDRTRTDWRFLA